MNANMKPDIHVTWDRSKLYFLRSLTAPGDTWVAEHLDPAHLCWGRSVVVEDHYIDSILDGIQDAGLSLEIDHA